MDILEKIEKLWDKKITRRDFVKKCLALGITAGTSIYMFDIFSRGKAFGLISEKRGMREALFYEKAGGGAVKCLLCPNQCFLSDGQRGFCRVREPADGKLYTLVYELICSAHIDPIEKKPLFHMLPGSRVFSIATAGCNSRCKFCQNWSISQKAPEEVTNKQLTCASLTQTAIRNNCPSIAYTYTEPVIFYEYMLDAAGIAKQNGLKNVMITGGKINPKPLRRLSRQITAANVDLKGFQQEYLKEVCAQDLNNILDTLSIMKEEGVWVEVTNLIVPTLNDNMDDIRRMSRWVRDNMGKDTPMHFSRFWPQYKLRSLYPTPSDTLKNARETALSEGLNYVYLGNAPEIGAETTVCPGCGKAVIKRSGYTVLENKTEKGKCGYCGHLIAGIWE